MGIVMLRDGPGGCGWGFHNDNASFLVNPTKRSLANLFALKQGWYFQDARSGVKVGVAGDAVIINGTTFTEAKGDIVGLGWVSPDGRHVGVSLMVPSSCVGAAPGFLTEMVTVASKQRVNIRGMICDAWWNNSEYLGSPQANLNLVNLYSLSGKKLVSIWTGSGGSLVGVLSNQ